MWLIVLPVLMMVAITTSSKKITSWEAAVLSYSSTTNCDGTYCPVKYDAFSGKRYAESHSLKEFLARSFEPGEI